MLITFFFSSGKADTLFLFDQNISKYYRSKVTKLEDQLVKIKSIYNLLEMNIKEQASKMNIMNQSKTIYNQSKDLMEHGP